jgi:hypothetical protein
MPFGLCNVLTTFQRIMNDVLREFRLKFVTFYLNDVGMYNRTLQWHIHYLRIVLQRFKEGGLKLRLRKCTFWIARDGVLARFLSLL